MNLNFGTFRDIFHGQHLLLGKVVVHHELEELHSAVEVVAGGAEVLLLAGLVSPPGQLLAFKPRPAIPLGTNLGGAWGTGR